MSTSRPLSRTSRPPPLSTVVRKQLDIEYLLDHSAIQTTQRQSWKLKPLLTQSGRSSFHSFSVCVKHYWTPKQLCTRRASPCRLIYTEDTAPHTTYRWYIITATKVMHHHLALHSHDREWFTAHLHVILLLLADHHVWAVSYHDRINDRCCHLHYWCKLREPFTSHTSSLNGGNQSLLDIRSSGKYASSKVWRFVLDIKLESVLSESCSSILWKHNLYKSK